MKGSDDLLSIALRPRPNQSEPGKITCIEFPLLFMIMFVANSIGYVAQTVYYRHSDYELPSFYQAPQKRVSFAQSEELGELHLIFPVSACFSTIFGPCCHRYTFKL
jgi:hypothetical protein